MITKENIDKFKSYGFILTPVLKSENKKLDKKPKIKNGKWFKDWKDEELLSAERLGVFHRDSKVFAIDPDDKTYAAHLFMPCLPPTFEDYTSKYGDVELFYGKWRNKDEKKNNI